MEKRSAILLVFTMIAVLLVSYVPVGCSDDSDATPGLEKYDAKVSPFTFPESKGAPVLKALSEADTSVDIEIYYLTSENVVGVLCKLAKAGVTVRVLADNTPNAVSTDKSFQMLKKLDDLGADVRLISTMSKSTHPEDRYDNVHAKYAVVDGDTVIVTSENWTQGNFSSSGNRGWGAIVQSTEYATHMTNIFETDYNISNADVKRIEDALPSVTAYSNTLSEKVPSYSFTWYDAKVSAVTSPDNSFTAMEAFMGTAQTRLYSEQLDLQKSYLTGTGPISWMNARAEAGVDTRLVLNASYDKVGEGAYKDVDYVNDNTKIKAAPISGGTGFSVTHNKGIIADDATWVGSVNWTPTSFNGNRECAVIIESKEIADYYAGFFETDFSKNYGKIDEITWKVHYVVDGKDTVVRVNKGAVFEPMAAPEKESTWLYTYKFSHWEGYSDGMTADGETTLTAVYDQSLNIPVLAGIGLVVLLAVFKFAFGGKPEKKRH